MPFNCLFSFFKYFHTSLLLLGMFSSYPKVLCSIISLSPNTICLLRHIIIFFQCLYLSPTRCSSKDHTYPYGILPHLFHKHLHPFWFPRFPHISLVVLCSHTHLPRVSWLSFPCTFLCYASPIPLLYASHISTFFGIFRDILLLFRLSIGYGTLSNNLLMFMSIIMGL